jgi:diguanylate cyclase (GGDEF)-like protein
MFLRYAEKEFERHKRYKSVFSIALMDIDHFKVINDTYGHNEGDEVLRIMTNAINCNLRKSDVFARWGGEEFILLMPETNLSGAKIAAEKVRELVSCQNYGIVGKVTVSVGVAVAGNDETLEHLVARADEKLYLAKENGRNRTEI